MKTILFLAGLIIFSSTGFALSGAEGHGGGAFVCRDENGKISQFPVGGSSEPQAYPVEIQDLWEGISFSHLPIVRDDKTPWADQFEDALAKLQTWDKDLYQKTRVMSKYVLANRVDILSGASIATPHDANSQYVKQNCPLEGAASFDEASGDLLLNPTIVSWMHPTDYAALMFHESIYKVLREMGDENSTRARHFTAFMFSQAPVVEKFPNIPKWSLTKFCQTEDTNFSFVLFMENQKLYAQFGKVDGFSTLAVTKTEITPRADSTMSYLEQLYTGMIGENRGKSPDVFLNFGLNHYDSPTQEVLQVQSPYEKFVFVIGNKGLQKLNCQDNPL